MKETWAWRTQNRRREEVVIPLALGELDFSLCTGACDVCDGASCISSAPLVDLARSHVKDDSYKSPRERGRSARFKCSAPIRRLPVEILAKIFKASISPNRDDPFKRIWLMMVCHHWHSVMMEFPTLWSSLILNNVRVTATMLKRSKTAPLVVEADLHTNTRDDVAAVKLALSHLSRTQVLHISGTDRSLRKLFPEMHQPAPLLESLRLAREKSFAYTVTIPSGLFKGVTPQLRHFAVQNFSIAWDCPFLYNLTYLEIENCSPKPSITEFRRILARCPALDTLILANSPSSILRQQYQSQNQAQAAIPIALSKFSHLTLVDDVLDVNDMVHNLSILPTMTVVLFCEVSDNPPLELPRLLTRLVAHCVGDLSILGLSIETSMSIRCEVWTTQSRDSGDPSLYLTLKEDLHFRSEGYKPFLIAICNELSLTALSALKISAMYQSWDFGLWTTLFGCMQKLRLLVVSANSINGLIPALRPILANARGESSRCEICLPELQELALHQVGFDRRLRTCAGLQQCLMLRRENGTGLKKLKLFKCSGLFEDDVEGLTQAVCSLEWG
jgi:hypothetical protein